MDKSQCTWYCCNVCSDDSGLWAWHWRALQTISWPRLLQLPESVVSRLHCPSFSCTLERCSYMQFCCCCTVQQCKSHDDDSLWPTVNWRRDLWQQLWWQQALLCYLYHRSLPFLSLPHNSFSLILPSKQVYLTFFPSVSTRLFVSCGFF